MSFLDYKDIQLIHKISVRYYELTNIPIGITARNLTRCQINCPLKLAELLAAVNYDFRLEVMGINAHLNYDTDINAYLNYETTHIFSNNFWPYWARKKRRKMRIKLHDTTTEKV